MKQFLSTKESQYHISWSHVDNVDENGNPLVGSKERGFHQLSDGRISFDCLILVLPQAGRLSKDDSDLLKKVGLLVLVQLHDPNT